MLRIYIETSVWGMVSHDQNPALREPTLKFLDQCERRIFPTPLEVLEWE